MALEPVGLHGLVMNLMEKFRGLLLVYKQGIHYVNRSNSAGNLVTVSYPISMPTKTLFAIRTTFNEDEQGYSHWNRDTRSWTNKSLAFRADYAFHCKDYYILAVGF